MCDGNVVIKLIFNNISKDININFNEINNLDGVNGFFSFVSNRLQYQLTPKQYDIEMRSLGVERIIKMGIAFYGKQVEILVEE